MSEEPEELPTDFAEVKRESLFSFAINDDDENKEALTHKVLSVPEVDEEEEEKKEEGAEDTTPEEEAQETVKEVSDVIQEEAVETKQKEETAQTEAPEEQIEVAKQIPAEQEDEWKDTPSDFVVRTQSEFLQGIEIPDDDIVSQVSGLTMFSTAPTPPPPVDQKRRKSDSSRKSGRRRSSVRRDRRISGDFKAAVETSSFSIKTLLSEFEGESMESVSEEAVIEEPVVFDREAYYEMYEELATDILSLKIRNNFFQKKMTEYFKKRKMEHVLRETDQQFDTQKRYFKKLDDLWELLQLDETRRSVINAELNELTKERNENADVIKKMTKQLLDKEKEVGTGLIHTKTGKEIPEKVIENLLKRQRSAVEQIAKQHLKFIKIRNRVTEKQEAIQHADTLGANLRLVDYEQLKVENRVYADKLEERDDELIKLRLKCDEIFQILAHLREKSASASLDIINEQNVLQAIEIEFMEARERKNYFKVERDYYRNLVNKLKEDSGILLKPRLLQDMEYAVNEAGTIANTLQKVREKQKTQLSKLRAIRKNMEIAINYRMTQEIEKLTPALSRASGLQRGRSEVRPEGRVSMLEDRLP